MVIYKQLRFISFLAVFLLASCSLAPKNITNNLNISNLNITKLIQEPKIEDADNTSFLENAESINNQSRINQQSSLMMMFYSEVVENSAPTRQFIENSRNELQVSPIVAKIQKDDYSDVPEYLIPITINNRVYLISGIDKSSSIYEFRQKYLKDFSIIGETAYYSKTPPTPTLIKDFVYHKKGSLALVRTYFSNELKLYFTEIGVVVKKQNINAKNYWESVSPTPFLTNLPKNYSKDGKRLISETGVYTDTLSKEQIYITKTQDKTDPTKTIITGYIMTLPTENSTQILNSEKDAIGKVRFSADAKTLTGYYVNESRMPLQLSFIPELSKGYLRLLLPNGEIRYLVSVDTPEGSYIPAYIPPKSHTSYSDTVAIKPMVAMATPITLLFLALALL